MVNSTAAVYRFSEPHKKDLCSSNSVGVRVGTRGFAWGHLVTGRIGP